MRITGQGNRGIQYALPYQRRARHAGLSVRGGDGGFPWANLPDGNALAAWDFLINQARWNGSGIGALSNTPGWSFTRASTGYAQTSAGALTAFATGVLRRTDKGVLIEGARTNLCLQSQTFDNASWVKTTATVTADAAVAPDGTTTADKLVEDSSLNQHRLNQVITVSNTTAYTFSVYAKALERLNINMRISTTSTVADASFNLQAGTALTPGAGTSTITALVGGWYRCSITGTTDSTSATVRINLGDTASNATQATYTGDGASGVYLWGAQLEQASFPSSLVTTTTASATRAADFLTVPVSVSAPFSLLLDAEPVGTIASVDGVSFDTTTNGSGIYLGGTGIPNAWVRESSATTAAVAAGSATAIGTPFKVAARFANNDTKACQGGTLSSADASNSPPATTTLKFGAVNIGGTSSLIIRRCALWTRALSDSELQTVTT